MPDSSLLRLLPMLVAVENPSEDEGVRRLRLRYPATCVECGIALSKGAEAYWNRGTRDVVCLACAPGEPDPAAERAGASAAAEGDRRTNKRVEEARRRHGDHAAEVARVMAGRDNAASWGKGSNGERWLAQFIAKELGDAVIGLHDRLIPGTKGNIDHIFIAPTGIWVVDAKAYKGKVEMRDRGPLWQSDNQLFIGGRNRTSLAKGVHKQTEAVLAAVRTDDQLRGTLVHSNLCLVESEWALLDFPFVVDDVLVLSPGALKRKLKKKGPLSREAMERVARRLDLSLPRAV